MSKLREVYIGGASDKAAFIFSLHDIPLYEARDDPASQCPVVCWSDVDAVSTSPLVGGGGRTLGSLQRDHKQVKLTGTGGFYENLLLSNSDSFFLSLATSLFSE